MSTTTDSLYLEASRKQLRFETTGGLLTTEDLWTLNLPSLDRIAVAVNARLTEDKGTFLSKTSSKKTLARSTDEHRLEILKVVIGTKETEAEEAKLTAARREKLAQLNALREKKIQDNLGTLTVEEIDKEIAALSS